MTAIQAATTTAAELLRLERSVGVIESGFEAGVIAVEGNPLDNPRVLQDVLLVASNGRVVLDRLDFGKRMSR